MKTTPWVFITVFCMTIVLAQWVPTQTAQSSDGSVSTVTVPCEQCAQVSRCSACGQSGPMRGPRSESFSKYYNCRYHGSYNHPVPPQFTYFWPGIYKQKSIADYQSVYRNTLLTSPSDVFNQNVELTPSMIPGHQTIIEEK